MHRYLVCLSVLLAISSSWAFAPTYQTASRQRRPLLLAMDVQDLTKPEQTVYNLVDELHQSHYVFRIIVVGNGAILETTSELGPVLKLNQSPKSQQTILTLASPDQSFEFHIQTAQVSKIVLTEKETPSKVMRILRFLNAGGDPMCSLILLDDSDEATRWYRQLRDTYGEDVQL